MSVNASFNAALHPKNAANGRFVETRLGDPGHVLGTDDADQATSAWTKRGLSPETAERWSAAGFTPAASDEWRRSWFPADEAAAWRDAGVDPRAARDWSDRKFSPAQAASYIEAGFTAVEAQEWRDADLPLPPAPTGDMPPRGDGGPADLTLDQIGAASAANPYTDLVMPPQEVPSLRR